MAKASGGTIRVDKTHSSYDKISSTDIKELVKIDPHWYGGLNRKTNEILLKLGNKQEDIDATVSLIKGHIEGMSEQDLADERLSVAIEQNTPVCRVIKDIDAISRRYLSEKGLLDNEVYRGGEEKNVESWTPNRKGVDTPTGHIYPDKNSTYRKLTKTHYILQGVVNGYNYHESEVTFVRKNSTLSKYRKQHREQHELN